MGVVSIRTLLLASLAVSVAAAQQTSVYSSKTVGATDGPEVVTTSTKTGTETTERMQSINGRLVPLERVEEHVVRDDASGKVTERLIRRFDNTGNPLRSEKVVIDERKGPGGSSTVQTSKYYGDVNGRMALQERSTTDTKVSGSTETSDTVVEKPSPNGGMDTAQKESKVVVKNSTGYEETAVIYRKDPTGNLYTAARRVTDHTETPTHSTDNIAQYEVLPTGQLGLHDQTVRNVDKRSNGTQEIQVDLLVKNLPGQVNDTNALQLKEHQIIERSPVSNGVKETVSVQRPTLSDPRRLGPPQPLSETVCRGKCDGLQ